MVAGVELVPAGGVVDDEEQTNLLSTKLYSVLTALSSTFFPSQTMTLPTPEHLRQLMQHSLVRSPAVRKGLDGSLSLRMVLRVWIYLYLPLIVTELRKVMALLLVMRSRKVHRMMTKEGVMREVYRSGSEVFDPRHRLRMPA